MKLLWNLLLGVILSISVAHAQINVVPVNGGTGNLVSVPIPGGSGLAVTVGTGSAAIPLQDIRTNPNAVNITTGDDSFNNVPLGFDFPFYGRVFNNSWAMTNGLVTFQDPWQSGLGGACCEGVDLRTTTNSAYNYTIYGMHSDLFSHNGQNQYYLREGNSMTYGWYNLSQCCSGQGGNSFEIKIDSLGLVDTRIAGAMVSGNRVTSGMAGNLANGEFYQAYHGSGLNIIPGSANIFSWQALGGTGAADMCTINPLSSPACAGYQAAYTVQQCSISALYDPSCPGYQSAYTTLQCSVNPLFSEVCPGYRAAYLQQQCSIDPLYSTTCNGYQQAYENQQCSLNPLFSTGCPGYASAYLDQQCRIDPLYSTTCSGYEQAYLNSQCIIDSLYSNKCEGYATAYAIKYLVTGIDSTAVNQSLSNTAATKANDPTNTKVEIASVATSISNDGTVSVGVSSTGDTNVDRAIAPKQSSPSGSQPGAPVQLVAQPPAAMEQRQENKQEEKKADSKPEGGPDKPSGGQQQAQGNDSGGSKSAPTARQEIQAKRQEAARAKAVESGKQLANEMGKAADMESQKAVQNVVIQAMGFTPGFDAYGKTFIPDGAGYKPFEVYRGQRNIDNPVGRRLMTGSDKLHTEMIDSQYNFGRK